MQSKKKEGESELFFFLKNVGQASFSAMVAESLTIPMDTAKVRLQIQKTEAGQKPKYSGLINTVKMIRAEEGPRALFNGLVPGLQRQLIFAGLRVGLYVPVRDLITGPLPEGVNPTVPQKILAAMATGTIGISVANPTDLVKVKMQGQGAQILQGGPRLYNNSMDCYAKLYRQGGIGNLWTGWGPNVMRNSIINAAELASYDQYKQMALASGIFKDGIPCHIFCACSAGFTACVVGSPVDVLKTRVMNATKGMYSNPIDCFMQTLKKEGFFAFYKGFGPNVGRLCGWNVVMFLTLEQVKKAMA